jgi:hypothetical protein
MGFGFDTVRRKGKRTLCFVLSLVMVLSMMPPAIAAGMGDLTTEEPLLLVTGGALIGDGYTEGNISFERAYTLAELQALSDLTAHRLYSAINRVGTMQIFMGEGVDIAGLLSLSGYSGDSVDVAAIDGFRRSIDLGVTRYYYPGVASGSSGGAEEVSAMLMWSSARAGAPTVPDVSAMEEQTLQLIIGQENITDINNSIFVNNANRLIAGNNIEEKLISVLGEEFTRAEILLMPRAEWTYSYETQLGARNDRVRGVPLAVLLEALDNDAVVLFETADGFNVPMSGKTKAELVAMNAILSYEVHENNAWNGIFRTARNGPEVGYFTLYADGERPSHMINAVNSGSAAFSDLAGFEWAVPAIEALAEAGALIPEAT